MTMILSSSFPVYGTNSQKLTTDGSSVSVVRPNPSVQGKTNNNSGSGDYMLAEVTGYYAQNVDSTGMTTPETVIYEDNAGYADYGYNSAGNYYDYSSYYRNSSKGYLSQGGCFLPDKTRRCGNFYIDGWVDVGVTSNPTWPLTTSATNASSTAVSEIQMNQTYLVLGRDVSQAGCWDIGGRVDLLFGTDYLYTSAVGLETSNVSPQGLPVSSVYAAEARWNKNSRGGHKAYGLAMPQLYGEIYAPWMAGLDVKLGHFYSPLGYESVMSTNNFFYSHSYTMQYGEPQTMTGIIGTLKLNPCWSVTGGLTEGWNIWNADRNSLASDKLSWLGGLKWENICQTSSVSFMLSSGQEMARVEGNTTSYSLVYEQQITPFLHYVLQHDLGITENGGYYYDTDRGLVSRVNAKWYSIINYVYYQLNEWWSLGFRAEWFKDVNNSRILQGAVAQNMPYNGIVGDEYVNLSLGLNWKPTPWITVRPEVRWDSSNVCDYVNGNQVIRGVYDDYSKDDMVTVGGDMVIRF